MYGEFPLVDFCMGFFISFILLLKPRLIAERLDYCVIGVVLVIIEAVECNACGRR